MRKVQNEEDVHNEEVRDEARGSEVRSQDHRDLEKRIITLLKQEGSVDQVKEELLKYAEE